MGKKLTLVVGINPDNYEIDDQRLRKPVWYQKIQKGEMVGSGLFQEMDQIIINHKELTYFQPNNIALLLSISNKQISEASSFFKEHFLNTANVLSYKQFEGNKKEFIGEKSRLICDFIELIETSVVFSYTALEAFSNISIPNDYKYSFKSKDSKVIYNKSEIERWISLRDKLTKILPIVFRVKKPTQKKWWGNFIKLEKYRHNIIHQKSIDSTDFYKEYFKEEIFNICNSAELAIKYFYEETAKQRRTHIMWPWLKKSKNEFPISFNYGRSNFEIIGNLYEGIKKS